MNPLVARLEEKAHKIRRDLLDMCIKAGTGHVTSALSCVDILVALYYSGALRVDPKNPHWPERDRFVLSKGHASPAVYAVLADMGFYDESERERFAQKDGMFGVLLQNNVPGVEITSGSLGHGLGVASGMALGARMNRELHMTYVLLGDGECHEGSVWETAMFASHNRLNNLVAIIDRNGMCVTDFTENIVQLEPLEERWAAFGWDVRRCDGHSIAGLVDALAHVRTRPSAKPRMIIADTVKGYGVDTVSNVPLWHGLAPKGDVAERCREELERNRRNG